MFVRICERNHGMQWPTPKQTPAHRRTILTLTTSQNNIDLLFSLNVSVIVRNSLKSVCQFFVFGDFLWLWKALWLNWRNFFRWIQKISGQWPTKPRHGPVVLNFADPESHILEDTCLGTKHLFYGDRKISGKPKIFHWEPWTTGTDELAWCCRHLLYFGKGTWSYRRSTGCISTAMFISKDICFKVFEVTIFSILISKCICKPLLHQCVEQERRKILLRLWSDRDNRRT